jgi:inhibitor of cysteine peptidase
MLSRSLSRSKTWALGLMLVLLVALSACSPLSVFAVDQPEPTPVAEPTPAYLEDVLVESIEILMLESFPVQVQVAVRGQLPDACSFIEKVEQLRGEDQYTLTLFNARYPNMRCAPQPTPFEENIMLDVVDLPAGTYTVDVHGVEAVFELPVDNTLGEE